MIVYIYESIEDVKRGWERGEKKERKKGMTIKH